MKIVLEGFDMSGKSTLASQLGLPVLRPRPIKKNHFSDRILDMQTQRMLLHSEHDLVFDRLTCISDLAYDVKASTYKQLVYQRELKCLLQSVQDIVIVYCIPSKQVDLSMHEFKGTDTKASIDNMIKNQDTIQFMYEEIMQQTPHIVYDFHTMTVDDIKDEINMFLGVR